MSVLSCSSNKSWPGWQAPHILECRKESQALRTAKLISQQFPSVYDSDDDDNGSHDTDDDKDNDSDNDNNDEDNDGDNEDDKGQQHDHEEFWAVKKKYILKFTL